MMRVAIVFLLATISLRADMADQVARFKKLPPGISVSPPHAIEGMAMALARTNPIGYAEKLPVTGGPGFETSMRIVTRRSAEHPWSFHASAKTAAAVKRGDIMLAVFWARAAGASEEAECAFVFEHGKPPNERSGYLRFECTREWQLFFVPFRAARDSDAGDAVIRFHAGLGPQVIEIGGLDVFNYEHRVGLGDLPYTPLNYKGREAGAKWRTDAEARINKLRKAPMFITVRNAKGKIVPWTSIRVRQVKHEFDFGTAVSAEQILATGDDADKYREIVTRSYNKVTFEKDLQWPEWESHRERALDAVAWLQGAGVTLRGQTLLRPQWKHLPRDAETLAGKPDELRKRILDHTRDIVGTLSGLATEWDVINESALTNDLQAALGPGILASVFKTAHETDPKARLFINEAGILSGGGTDSGRQDAYFTLVKSLIDAKAPVQGIGMQAHFDDKLTPPARVWEILDRFSSFRLPIKVTEFDVNVWDEQAMADYTRDFMTAVFAHPATTGFVLWGFWEKQHPIANAAHWSLDWNQRPAGKVWEDLVLKKWWTNARVETSGRGVAKLTGFLGDYVIELGSGEKMKTIPFKLTKEGKWMTVVMP